jgi:hypothetical protein
MRNPSKSGNRRVTIGVGIPRNTNRLALQQPHAKQVSQASEGSTSFSEEKEAKRLLFIQATGV